MYQYPETGPPKWHGTFSISELSQIKLTECTQSMKGGRIVKTLGRPKQQQQQKNCVLQ